MTSGLTIQKPPRCPNRGKRDMLPSEDSKVWYCSNCLEGVRLTPVAPSEYRDNDAKP